MSGDSPRPIRYESLDELIFDPENPRLPTEIDATDEKAVLAWLLEDTSLVDLMRSIAAQGYFDGEPILVTPADDKYIVVEGNRRLAALRLLQKPSLAPVRKRSVSDVVEDAKFRPDVVPVVQFDHRGDVLDYLGYRHVTGIKPWEPLAKARYVKSMWERLARELPDERRRALRIASLIGSGKRTDVVLQMLTALGLYDRLTSVGVIGDTVPPSDVDFSLFSVALARKQIPTWLGLSSGQDYEMGGVDEGNLQLFGHWVFERNDENETVLGESRNMTKLAAIVAEPRAVDELIRTDDIERALKLTPYASVDLLEHLDQARNALYAALSQLPDVETYDPDNLEVLREISRVNKRIYDALRALAIDEVDEI